MRTRITQDSCLNCDALVLPFAGSPRVESLPELLKKPVEMALEQTTFSGEKGSIHTINLVLEERFVFVVLLGFGEKPASGREVFLHFAKGIKKCREAKAAKTAVFFDLASQVTHNPEIAGKLFQVPFLVDYDFQYYKSVKETSPMEEVVFISSMEGLEGLRQEAEECAAGTRLARDLVNHPSVYMTPKQFGKEFAAMGEECQIQVEILEKEAVEALGMEAFLSVARGAVDEPVVAVMRYHGAADDSAPVALIGKGVMFDSGGYSLKSKMATMHDDMGGGAAVVGAMRAIARQKLPINVVAIVAACKNMISGDAYVPGDIIGSMNGKTIEMLNTDAEGRLTLADAITYAIRKEGAETIFDIATLTGAAKGAVGGRSAAVISNDDGLWEILKAASVTACEKVWRLDADTELFPVLKSSVADLKSSNPGNTLGGGCIVAGLFIQEFVEGKPWVHIDMAPVNWLTEENAYCVKGGTGYGVDLLYQTVKRLCRQ